MTDKLSVLVVDDEVLVRMSAVDMLEDAGFTVVGDEGSAEAALTWLDGSSHPLDLLFTDLTLPGMDGHALSHTVRAKHPGTAIVIVTGHAGLGVRSKGDRVFELGKPFTVAHIEELKSLVSAGAAG